MERKSSVRVFALQAHLEIRLGMDYVKNVVNPIRLVAPRDSIRGFVDDFYNITEDVLLLKGEIHYERKPVSGLSDVVGYILRCVALGKLVVHVYSRKRHFCALGAV